MRFNWKRSLLVVMLIVVAIGRIKAHSDTPKKDDMAPDVAALKPANNGQARIDVVFAIDCSGSMGPVIETAKKKVWTIVNEIAKAKPSPVLRIGLIGYGDGAQTFRSFPLSDDLDTVYGNLMTFKDEGWGSEYVGLTLHKAITEMKWSETAKIDLKVIYVLGNETARQGPDEFDYSKTAPQAAAKNIFINAIYCNANVGQSRNALLNNPANNQVNNPVTKPSAGKGKSNVAPQQQGAQQQMSNVPIRPELDGETATWMEMASLGKGKFLEIAGDGGAITLPTPYDEEMIKLNSALNDTYIPYGAAGERGFANQKMQDSNAATVGGAANMASRSQAKGSGLYNNRSWDLVDASRENDFDWAKVKDDELPANLKGKSLAERKKYVEQNATKRAALQAQLGALGRKRDEYLAIEIKKQNLDTGNAIDDAVRRSVTEQGKTRGFTF